MLDRAPAEDRFVVTLCHGRVSPVAAGRGKVASPFAGCSVSAFPDALGTGANPEIAYLPGPPPAEPPPQRERAASRSSTRSGAKTCSTTSAPAPRTAARSPSREVTTSRWAVERGRARS